MPLRRQDYKDEALLRLLRYALGHAPQEFALLPDAQGWVSLKELVKALHEDPQLRFVRESLIRETANRLGENSLETTETRIRFLGQSPPSPEYGAQPPAHLYYGARRRGYAVLREQGLPGAPGSHILLSTEKEKALLLGRRRDQEPVLTTVQAHKAQGQGVIFAAWGEKVFICDWLPPDCLLGPPAPEDLPLKKPAKAKPAPEPDPMPGSFLIPLAEGEKPYKRKGLKKDIAWKKDRRQGRRQKDEW